MRYGRVCLPLYATTPLDATRFSRIVVNPDLSAHFKHEWNAMDLRHGLAAVECPVLVVGGELDPICPMRAVDEVVEALPDRTRQGGRACGASHLEAAVDGIAAVVRKFIVDYG